MEDKAELASIAYYNNPSRRKYAEDKGIDYLEKYSSPNRAVFKRGDRIEVAYRGSTTGQDWYRNVFGLGDITDPINLRKSPQDPFNKDPDFREDSRVLKEIRREYPNDSIDHIGHSRGGARARNGFYTDKNGKVYTFNSAFTPNELEKYKDFKTAYPDSVTNYRTKRDLVSGAIPDSVDIDSASKPLLSQGGRFIAKQAVKPVANYFGFDGEEASKAFDRGIGVAQFIKDRADAHSMTNFLDGAEMERLANTESREHYNTRDYEGQDFRDAFPRLRGTAAASSRKAREERQRDQEEYDRIMYQNEAKASPNEDPDDEETDSRSAVDIPVQTRETIQNVIDQERKDRDIKTVRELIKEKKNEERGKSTDPQVADLFEYSEADNLRRDEEVEYQNLTRGGFIFLHSGTGDSGGRFVNYANNPYGLDQKVSQGWGTDWYTGCDYPEAGDLTSFATAVSPGEVRFNAVGGPNGQFFSANGPPIDDPSAGGGTVQAFGQDTSEMTFHWDRPFTAPRGYNLTLTCIEARVDNTIYNIYNTMANEAIPKYWGYCNPLNDLQFNNVPITAQDAPTIAEAGKLVNPPTNPWFYTGYKTEKTPRFDPPMTKVVIPNDPTLRPFHNNPLPYRGLGMSQGLSQIQGNDVLLFTIQYSMYGYNANGTSKTYAVTIRSGKYTGKELELEIVHQLETTQVNFDFPDDPDNYVPIPADKKRLRLADYVSVAWLPSQMKFKFTNVSQGHQIADDVVPNRDGQTLFITKNVFYVYLIVAPSKLVWSNAGPDILHPDFNLWKNPFPNDAEKAGSEAILQMFKNRICLTPLGIPELNRPRIIQGLTTKGNINPYTEQGFPDGLPKNPVTGSGPDPVLPAFGKSRMGNIPIFSETFSNGLPGFPSTIPSSPWGSAQGGGQGFYVIMPADQDGKFHQASGTNDNVFFYPLINIQGCPPKGEFEAGVSETRNPYQPVLTNTGTGTTGAPAQAPQGDRGVFFSPMVANLIRTRNIFIETDYDTNSVSSSTAWSNRDNTDSRDDYEGIRPYLFGARSNTSILAAVPVKNPVYEHTSEAVYEPDNPFNMRTIRIPNNSLKKLTIRLKSESGDSIDLNGGTYNIILKVGLIPTQTTKFSLPTLNEYNEFVRKFYRAKSEKEKNKQKKKIINL